MSGVDSELDKQPISSVNGQSGDSDIVSPGKENLKDRTPPTEGLKGASDAETTAIVSSHSEEAQSLKEGLNEDEAKDSHSPGIMNGEIAGGHEDENEGESPVRENKTDGTPEEVLDNKQVNNGLDAAEIENEMVEAKREVEKAPEQSEPEKNNDAVSTAVADGEQNKVETEPVEVEKTVDELKEGAVAYEKLAEEKSENQSSEESKVAVTDPEAADRKRAVTIDNPVDMNEVTVKSGGSPLKADDIQARSKTLGDIEGKASSHFKEDVAIRSRTIWYTDEVEDTLSKPDSATTEETISYSTSIVGGVVHRMPISSSPKIQHKPKEGGSPQLSPSKKKSVLDTLFGRNKKSKGGSESPQRSIASVQDAEKGHQQSLPESTPVVQNGVEGGAKSESEPSDSGPSAEMEEPKSADVDQETQAKAATEKDGGDHEIKVAPVAQSEEDVEEERTEAKEGEAESQDVQEVPVPGESAEEKNETNAEAPEGEQPEEPKEAAKRAHSDLPEEEMTSPQPASKKKKPIFGGIFTRRKSKKSKGDLGSPPAETTEEKEGVKGDEEQQGESMPTKPADDAKLQVVEEVETVENETDEVGSPDASQTTDTAQKEVTINPSTDEAVESASQTTDTAQKEVTEDAVNPSTDEVVESASQTTDTAQKEVTEDAINPSTDEAVESASQTTDTAQKEVTEDAINPSTDEVVESASQTTDTAQKEVTEDAINPSTDEAVESASQTTDTAQKEVTEDAINPSTDETVESASQTTDTAQKEVTEDAINPSTDEAVESTKEEIADEREQEVQTATGGEEPSAKEEGTVKTDGVEKSFEEPVQSTDADGAVDKEETEQQPDHSQDSQPEKKQSFFSGLFGRRKSKKSKESPAETPQEKSDNVEEQQEDGCELAQAEEDTKLQAVVTVETLENGTDKNVTPETSDTTAAVEKEVTEAAISPEEEQAVESVKEDIPDKEEDVENIAEQEEAVATGRESSGKEEETVVPEDTQKPAGEPLQSKDADVTVENKEAEEVPVQSQESQPEKKNSFFSGLFARRKSKKSKGDVSSTPDEAPHQKDDSDQAVEEQQGIIASTQDAEDVTPQASESEEKQDSAVKDQDAPPGKTIDNTVTTGQEEVTEVVISPAVDQAVESAKDERADKVDGSYGEQESTSEQELTGKEVETTGPEDVNKSTEGESEIAKNKPEVEEPSEDTSKETIDSVKPAGEKESSPESEEAQNKDDAGAQERIALTHGSHSPKTRRMQMRISYAETTGEGGREVEVIGTPERVSEAANQKGKTPPDHRVACRDLGEADHEGWLAKRGGPLFFSSWKRKWVVLKEGKLYYFKTSFDPEASGVINMEGVTVAPAPDTKKNFCFKCEQPGPKPQMSLFMADSKEDMEKWLTVLTAASKGEVIQKTKQHHLTPMGEVVMRKKSGSISTQRTSSVLAVGGRPDFLEDEEDFKATRRRSTPGSLSRSPEEMEGKDKRPSVSSGTHPVISETQLVPEDTEPVLSDTQEVPRSEPSDDKPEETSKSGGSETAEKPVPVVDEVLVSSEKMAVESVPVVEVSTRQDTPPVESSGDPVSEVATSQDEEEGSKEQASVSDGVTAEAESPQPEQESAPDVSDSAVDQTDGAVSVVTTESSLTVVETVKSTSVISEKVETVVSVVETEVTEVSSAQQPPETEELKQDAKEDIRETSPTQNDEPVSPSKTKWYFTLDRQETWSVPTEVELEKSSSPPRSPGSSSDKVSINSDRQSIKSEKGSIKSSSDDDELLVMCQNLRKARLSIVGDHVWDVPERLRAFSSVHDDKEKACVRLRTLERTLKDKEKHLSELDELLAQPEINRDSIYAWKLRYSDLVEEFFPQYDGDTQEENNNTAAEGADSETQDQESSKAGKEDVEVKSLEGLEKEVKEEKPEEVAKKSGEEQATSSKDEEEGKVAMEDKQVAEETVREQETVREEQQSSEKQEDSEQKEDNNLIVTVEIQQLPAERVSVTDSEQNVQETETEHDKQEQEEIVSEQRLPDSQEQSLAEEDSEDVKDTRL